MMAERDSSSEMKRRSANIESSDGSSENVCVKKPMIASYPTAVGLDQSLSGVPNQSLVEEYTVRSKTAQGITRQRSWCDLERSALTLSRNADIEAFIIPDVVGGLEVHNRLA